jgi:hypothetical protein
VLQRTFAEIALAVEIVDRHVRSRAPTETSGSERAEAVACPSGRTPVEPMTPSNFREPSS